MAKRLFLIAAVIAAGILASAGSGSAQLDDYEGVEPSEYVNELRDLTYDETWFRFKHPSSTYQGFDYFDEEPLVGDWDPGDLDADIPVRDPANDIDLDADYDDNDFEPAYDFEDIDGDLYDDRDLDSELYEDDDLDADLYDDDDVDVIDYDDRVLDDYEEDLLDADDYDADLADYYKGVRPQQVYDAVDDRTAYDDTISPNDRSYYWGPGPDSYGYDDDEPYADDWFYDFY